MQKIPCPKNKFGIRTTEYYKHIRNIFVDVTAVDKIFINLDVAKVSGIDQISAKFYKNDAPANSYSSRYHYKCVNKT